MRMKSLQVNHVIPLIPSALLRTGLTFSRQGRRKFALLTKQDGSQLSTTLEALTPRLRPLGYSAPETTPIPGHQCHDDQSRLQRAGHMGDQAGHYGASSESKAHKRHHQ